MRLSSDSIRALKSAIKIAGSQTALAKRIGTQQQNISYWLKKGRPPAEAAIAIERETGIARHRLRPDLFVLTGGDSRPPRSPDGSQGTACGQQTKQGRWQETKPRCPLCFINLVNDAPPSPCHRQECRHTKTSREQDRAILQSSLNGPDYEVRQ